MNLVKRVDFTAMRASWMAAIACVAAVSVGRAASADIPPDPGYVEMCTAERQQTAGIRCETCQRYHGRVNEACSQQMASRGWSERCQGGGASVGYALFCSAAAPAGFDPRTNVRRGCGSCAVGRAERASERAGVVVSVLAGLAIAWAGRRRRGR